VPNTHQRITNDWNEFRRNNPNATRAQIEQFADLIDRRYAHYFWENWSDPFFVVRLASQAIR
jgi:hypothetical protein